MSGCLILNGYVTVKELVYHTFLKKSNLSLLEHLDCFYFNLFLRTKISMTFQGHLYT